MGPRGMVQETRDILKVAINFYKGLFKCDGRGSFCLEENFWDLEDLVSSAELEKLEAPFSDKEIKEAVFSFYPEGALGPDGISLFYQKYWEVVKEDIYRMVRCFHAGDLEFFRLNFAMLTLISKVDDATDMKNYRPISLLNCSFKIFSKLLTIRLDVVC
jgi:hypothetical protein